MIYPGTDLKWMVTVNIVGFDINEDDMELVIKNHRGRVKYSYKASDFFSDGDGHWFFTMTYEEAAGFVDLGLPSGLKWAQSNIVKTGSKYEIGVEHEYGAYVSWGNIEPHFSVNDSTFDDNYFCGISNEGVYANTPGSHIAFTSQGEGFSEDSGYDAARELLGGKWKMPTTQDFKELNDNCTSTWVEGYNGTDVNGRLFRSKINGAKLCFPAAGKATVVRSKIAVQPT